MSKPSKQTLDQIQIYNGDELNVDLWYPDTPNPEYSKIVVGLVDVRAADDIRISYDKGRDGWSIEQASKFSWESGDAECDCDWQEVAFVQAWGREEPTDE